MSEVVLLVEESRTHGAPVRLRAVTIPKAGAWLVLEQCHLGADVFERRWENDGERDLTGRCRVFREPIAANFPVD